MREEAVVGRSDFVTYDELRGLNLDAALWMPARIPLPTGGEHLLELDPNAEVTVGQGEVRVTIPRFSLSNNMFQAADSVKYLMFSTRQFALAADRPTTFAADLAVDNILGQPHDFRRGIAAFQVGDLASMRVFSVGGTTTRVLAMHELLSGAEADEPFVHVIESPYEDFDDDFTRPRACEITLDRLRSTATWRVDGRIVYETRGALIPERARIGFGIFTMLPIRGGHSRRLNGQGITAWWRQFRVRGAAA